MIENIKFYNKVLNNKGKLKFTKRVLYYLPWGNNLTEFYRNHPNLSSEVLKNSKLLKKLNRPYVSLSFKVSEKLKLIKGSYKILDKNLSKEQCETLYKNGIFKISNFIGKEENEFQIFLLIYHACDKEGELQLVLVDSTNTRLSKITFSILDENIYIGGIQGAKREVNPMFLKDISKKLYGERAQKLILEALYSFKESLGLKGKIYGISGKSHMFNDKRYQKHKNKEKHDISILQSYDKFWKSIEGVLDLEKKVFYKLPDKLPRKNIEKIQSKKRSLYRNRYNLIDVLNINITNSLKNNRIEKINQKIKFL